MIDRGNTKDECIKSDLEWLKDELKDLTNEERCIILSSYAECVSEFGISMCEYHKFIKLFNEME